MSRDEHMIVAFGWRSVSPRILGARRGSRDLLRAAALRVKGGSEAPRAGGRAGGAEEEAPPVNRGRNSPRASLQPSPPPPTHSRRVGPRRDVTALGVGAGSRGLRGARRAGTAGAPAERRRAAAGMREAPGGAGAVRPRPREPGRFSGLQWAACLGLSPLRGREAGKRRWAGSPAPGQGGFAAGTGRPGCCCASVLAVPHGGREWFVGRAWNARGTRPRLGPVLPAGCRRPCVPGPARRPTCHHCTLPPPAATQWGRHYHTIPRFPAANRGQIGFSTGHTDEKGWS